MANAPGAPAAPARVPTPLLQKMKVPAKAATTTEPASPAATTTPTTTATGNHGTAKAQQPRRAAATSRTAPAATDPLSERATTLLIRRTLCPQQQQQQQQHQQLPHHNPKQPLPPIESVLPPLTSRNDVDLQLYAIIAIVLREFVQNWYAKITPDEDFVAEILLVIAHITRALEQRIRKVDLESLLFDELPELLDRHVTAYRAAHQPIVQPPLQANPREIYHSLWPTPALSPTPSQDGTESEERLAENEAAYRHLLVQGVLAVLLPTEDLENPCLTALVGQIISELIIGGVVAKKASEPWMLLLSQAIARHVLDPSQFPTILRTLRGVLFPNNAMGKSSLIPPANDEELRLLRLRCAASLYALIPRPLAKLYFGKSGKSNVGGGVDSSRPPTRSVPAAKSSSPPQKTSSSIDDPRDRPAGATIPACASASESKAAEANRAAAPTGYGPPLGHSDVEDERAVAELDADLLDVFSDAYCNKHLMYGIVELILVRLLPELGERGVVELLGERLS
ncbi:hypothetical protein PpBr36_05223 [Pyricularia pennisetigena]|uniref:hypothetical protein n=1 Tax=Pyricularia pennisetigena TaxID=1578925 RepID=UPI0011545CB4|nr:hypothetical protein PpBr36_05223 [Pyricularia pennisetigena]TLS26914.1 hypothetical protein PpBr36_05223 [Pyricularia pennisetigena]